MTYQQAIKRPQAGWAYADNESMLAVMSDVLGRAFCLNPERIFEWAKMHSSYSELRNRACELLDEPPEKMSLLVAVINDLPLERAAGG